MEYLQKTFSVAGHKAPEACTHGWTDPRGRYVKCGEAIGQPDIRPGELIDCTPQTPHQ